MVFRSGKIWKQEAVEAIVAAALSISDLRKLAEMSISGLHRHGGSMADVRRLLDNPELVDEICRLVVEARPKS